MYPWFNVYEVQITNYRSTDSGADQLPDKSL